ncbi:MAG: hypothetical protein KGL35_14275, partial [Bradyrhizobium sp.]|nr:hypothetical protein [Bradyrhizobium sp.]
GLDPLGSDITIAVFSPAATVSQYAKFLGAPGPNNAAVANGNSGEPLFGSATGQTGITSPLPYASYTPCPKPLFILNP